MDERGGLERVVQAADELIALVRGLEEVGGRKDDRNVLVMYGAYGHGFRRFVAIRNLANDGSAEEASILTRSLLNILVRACWIDEPTDPAARHDRVKRLLRRQYEDDLHEYKIQQAAGFTVDARFAAETRSALDQFVADGVKGLPKDKELFEALELGHVYAGIYAPVSNQMHFSMDTAIRDLLDVEEVALERPDYEDAARTLTLAILAFGILLEKSERAVRHGLGPEALAIGRRLMDDLRTRA